MSSSSSSSSSRRTHNNRGRSAPVAMPVVIDANDYQPLLDSDAAEAEIAIASPYYEGEVQGALATQRQNLATEQEFQENCEFRCQACMILLTVAIILGMFAVVGYEIYLASTGQLDDDSQPAPGPGPN